MAKDGKKQNRGAEGAAVFARDHHRCVICGSEGPLDAHHVTPRKQLPAGGYVAANGVTLCDRPGGCHAQAEHCLENDHDNAVYGPVALYRRIGSSPEQTRAESECLARKGRVCR